MFVGQEPVQYSTAPTWQNGKTQSSYVGLRVFLVAAGDSYAVVPGGLVSVATSGTSLDLSVLAADSSKDTWVLSDEPVKEESLLRPPGKPVELRRSGAALPSRVADNIFWLGRLTERAEGIARMLRPILSRLTSESEPFDSPQLEVLLHCLASHGAIEPGFVVDGMKDQLPSIESALPTAVLHSDQPGTLRATIIAAYRNASMVRDRLSYDSWRIIHGLQQHFHDAAANSYADLTDVLQLVNHIIIDLAALDGMIDESMTRTQAWQFLDLGARIERALYTIGLVRTGLLDNDEADASVLEAVLEVADSLMTYRSRYLASMQLPPVLDLLITDETNPRSLAYQLTVMSNHVDRLPRDDYQPLLGTEQRIAQSALNNVRMLDIKALYEKRQTKKLTTLQRMLATLSEQLPQLSRLISHRYLLHAETPRQLAASKFGSAGGV
jgi:uncharacterized alpha-E superfamily protein